MINSETRVILSSSQLNPLIGSINLEKSNSNGFCRKSGATVPHPVYTYQCWSKSSSGSQAEISFESFPISSEIIIGGSSDPLINNLSKINNLSGIVIRERISPDSTKLCQSVISNNTGATPIYTCFSISTSISPADAKAAYDLISTPEESLTFYRLFYTNVENELTFEKENSISFCRKSVLVDSNSATSYTCWSESLSGFSAQNIYESLPETSELLVQRADSTFTGGSTKTERQSPDHTTLCQSITEIYPGALPHFICFTNDLH